MRQALPAKAADSKIRVTLDNWARADYQAATQWAMTWPTGKDRDQTLMTIRDNWPKQDPAGKATFEKQYHIK